MHQNHHQGIFMPNERLARFARPFLILITTTVAAAAAIAQSTSGAIASSTGPSCLIVSSVDLKSVIDAAFFLYTVYSALAFLFVLMVVQGLILPWLDRRAFDLEIEWRDQIRQALTQAASK